MSRRGDEGLFLRCLKPLDERVSVKLLLRVWGPRFEFVVRLLLVATFLDDSLRAATHFKQHTRQIGEQGLLKPLVETSPELVRAIATLALGLGLLAQSLGSAFLLTLIQPDRATKALIGWALAQPFLYAQLYNVHFVAESLTLIGGLLILRAHLGEQTKHNGRRVPLGGGGLCAPDESAEAILARTWLLGRLLLPSVYLHHALSLLANLLRAHHSASSVVVHAAVLVGLVLGCALVAAGLRSRTVALSLALLSLGSVCYQHPFFLFVWREGGEWRYDEMRMRKSMPHVALPTDMGGMSPRDLESWHILDLHRYFFFLGLSTTGALLLLAQFGPGEMAVEQDEVLLGDVQKARDYRPVPSAV